MAKTRNLTCFLFFLLLNGCAFFQISSDIELAKSREIIAYSISEENCVKTFFNVPIKVDKCSRGYFHLLEHLLLRELNPNKFPGWILARTTSDRMVFQFIHFQNRTDEVFKLFSLILNSNLIKLSSVEKELKILQYEKMLFKTSSLPDFSNFEKLMKNLEKLHATYFVNKPVIIIQNHKKNTILEEKKFKTSENSIRTKAWQKLCDKIKFNSENLNSIKHSEDEICYIMLGFNTKSLYFTNLASKFLSKYNDISLLSVYISHLLYEQFILTGETYEATSYFDSEKSILGFWTFGKISEIEEKETKIKKILNQIENINFPIKEYIKEKFELFKSTKIITKHENDN